MQALPQAIPTHVVVPQLYIEVGKAFYFYSRAVETSAHACDYVRTEFEGLTMRGKWNQQAFAEWIAKATKSHQPGGYYRDGVLSGKDFAELASLAKTGEALFNATIACLEKNTRLLSAIADSVKPQQNLVFFNEGVVYQQAKKDVKDIYDVVTSAIAASVPPQEFTREKLGASALEAFLRQAADAVVQDAQKKMDEYQSAVAKKQARSAESADGERRAKKRRKTAK